MTDIKLQQIDGVFDIGIGVDDLLADDGLETAVIISLFSDARVTPDELPEGFDDPRGWWADTLDDGENTGSKMWLLSREKMLTGVLRKLQQYGADCLQWVIDDGIAESVNVITERFDLYTAAVKITIVRGSAITNYQYDLNWSAQVN